MGNYNPSAPQNLGNEWVGIRDEDLVFSPAVNAFEQGHGFTLATSKQVGDGRFYINDWPDGDAVGQAYLFGIYPRGYEDLSGPIQRVIIPCNSASITGSVSTGLVARLADPSDGLSVLLQGSTSSSMECFFAVNAYSLQLTGKRIVGVNLLYAAYSLDDFTEVSQEVRIQNDTGGNVNFGEMIGSPNDRVDQVRRIELGEINHFWSTAAPSATSERLPWIYSGLAKFEASASGRIRVMFKTFGDPLVTSNIFIAYAALEVLYCEEQRVAVGGRLFGSTSAGALPYVLGTNIIPMRNTSLVANPVLPAGQYSVVLSSANTGAAGFSSGFTFAGSKYPTLNALRELYSIDPHPPILTKIPFPTTENIVGRTFEADTTHVLPQISLHTTGGTVLTEPHVYGRQAAAPVYGGVVATQGIINSAYGVTPTNYPQVRFWARRFGETTVSLNFHNQSGLPLIQASITPTEFDALPEILDGWKEVTLTFSGGFTPSFTAGGTATTYEWSASGENVGSRWEVLGVIAPALSGVAGNLLNTVPTSQVLDSATYGGSTAFLAWLQPNSGATASDTRSDASVIFSQTMPTVVELEILTASQAVSGIGMTCADPRAVAPVVNTNSNFNTASGWTAQNGATLAYDPTWSYSPYQSAKVTPDGVGATPLILSADFSVVGNTSYTAAAWVYSVNGWSNSGIGFNWFDSVGGYLTSDTYFQGTVASKWTLLQAAFTTPANAAFGSMYILEGSTPATSDVFWVDEATIRLTTPENSSSGLNIPPECIPTGISYAQVSWTSFTSLYGPSSAAVTGFGYYELQRMDTIDTDWATIARISSASATSFLDYEPRVGILSSYRIRACDLYEFCGPWSSTVTYTLPSPGIAGTDGTGVLIFTANENQSGALNLAYTQTWESSPEDAFSFPEASAVRLQEFYNRDFVTAFRPLERGGERFEATLLIQAAAVSAPVLENVFGSLRDMAWATVTQICVRNELGDRWFATIIVPDGRVKRNRRLQLARIQVIEVSDVPCAVEL